MIVGYHVIFSADGFWLSGFAKYVDQSGLPVWACAILPDHVHLVVGRPPMTMERRVIQLKGAATRELEREGIHPLAQYQLEGARAPKCWVRGQWKVFLDAEDPRVFALRAAHRWRRARRARAGRN